jgi:formylglycine-generating enzyme
MIEPLIRFSVIILKQLNIHHIMKTQKIQPRSVTLGKLNQKTRIIKSPLHVIPSLSKDLVLNTRYFPSFLKTKFLLVMMLWSIFSGIKAQAAPPTPAKMVHVPAGKYLAGYLAERAYNECKKNNNKCRKAWFEDEEPIKEIEIDEFYIDIYEVTQKEYKKVTGKNPSAFKADNHPVESVTWDEANRYCKKFGKRLPTEAEWEKAAKGGKNTTYVWGNVVASNKANFCDANCSHGWKEDQFSDGYENTAPVGSFPPNGYGLYDMAGNVYEWVADWYEGDYNSVRPTRNPMGPASGDERSTRGGSWINYSSGTRPTDRSGADPDERYEYGGFRCAK